MKLVPGFHKWLDSAGYEFHCFISWPHIDDPDTIECARRFKADLESNLRQVIPEPKVFLSTEDIAGGDKWRRVLKNSLCRSLSMVAICAPIYYDPSHLWCGIEWAAMEQLAESRIPDEQFGAIIPVLIRRYDPLPEPVKEAQFYDISNGILLGKGFYRTNSYRQTVREIADRILEIASTIHANRIKPDCEEFTIPTESAFSNFHAEVQPAPFRERIATPNASQEVA